MKFKITIKDIAEKLQLTPATVSRALNNHPRISESTKKTVSDLARKLKYRRNTIASSLRSGKSCTIGVIIPSAGINFFGSIVESLETAANNCGYNILLYQSNELTKFEIQAIETFIGARVDGILSSVAKETVDFSHYLELKNREIPLVFFDRTNDSFDIPSVVIDDEKGAYLATEHLIKEGYKRIAHISGQQHVKIFKDRAEGYKRALRHYGHSVDDALIFQGDVSIQAGKDAMDYFINLPRIPDAIFCVEDFTALGVLKAAKIRGLKIPHDLGVIGFANEFFCEHITPSLSSIDQQTNRMGQEAFKLLYHLINDNKKKNKKYDSTNKVILEPITHFRESSNKIDIE